MLGDLQARRVRQRPELDRPQHTALAEHTEQVVEGRSGLVPGLRAQGPDHQQGCLLDGPSEPREQSERRGVGLVQILEDEHRGLRRHPIDDRVQALAHAVLMTPRQQGAVVLGQDGGEGIHQEPVAVTPAHGVGTGSQGWGRPMRSSQGGVDQRRLADPRRALEHDEATGGDVGPQCGDERGELGIAAEEDARRWKDRHRVEGRRAHTTAFRTLRRQILVSGEEE